jgi:hypothetical protein
MSVYRSIIANFITENQLNEELYNQLEAFAKQVVLVSKKPLVIENPSDAKSANQLKTKCRMTVLKTYCNENKILFVGTKDEICKRVWRFIEGTSEDGDFVPMIPEKERIQCSCINSKKKQCKNTTIEQYNGEYMCIRHMKLRIQKELNEN